MSSERLDPRAFAQKLNEWARGTMIGAHGTRFIQIAPTARNANTQA